MRPAKLILTLIFLGVCTSTLFSQHYFQKAFGDYDDDNLFDMYEVGTDTFLVLGKYEGGLVIDQAMHLITGSGEVIWSKTLGSTSNDNGEGGLMVSPNEIYLVGYTDEPGPASSINGQLIKADTSGTAIWAMKYGAALLEEHTSISTYTNTELYLSGFTFQNGIDMFVTKVDANTGTVLWSRFVGSPAGAELTFNGLATSDEGVLLYGVTDQGAGSDDLLLVKLDSTGTIEWNSLMGSTIQDGVHKAIEVSSGYLLLARTNNDNYIIKINHTGTVQWIKAYQMAGDEISYGIMKMNDNKFVVYGTCDGLGPSSEALMFQVDSSGNLLNAIAYGDLGGPSSSDFRTAAITSNNDLLMIGKGGATSFGIDGVYVVRADSTGETVCLDSNITGLITVVDTSYTMGSPTVVATSAGTAAPQTITSSTLSYQSDTACACTVPDTPVLSANDTTLCGQDSLMVTVTGGNLYDAPNWYWYEGSCGGTLVGTGTSMYLNPSTTTTYYIRGEGGFAPCGPGNCTMITISRGVVDTSVSVAGLMLTSNATGATYQWLDCDNSFAPISGETNQSYTATANGNYAVAVTENGCTDTSACYTISTFGINNAFDSFVRLYPNPTDGGFTLNMGTSYEDVSLVIRDITGRIIYERVFDNLDQQFIDLNQPSGIYLVEVHSSSKHKVLRLIKR